MTRCILRVTAAVWLGCVLIMVGIRAILAAMPPGGIAVFVPNIGSGLIWVDVSTGMRIYRPNRDFSVPENRLPAAGCHLPVLKPGNRFGFLDIRTGKIRGDIPIPSSYYSFTGTFSPDEHYRWMTADGDGKKFYPYRLILNLDTGEYIQRDDGQYSLWAQWSPDSRHLFEYTYPYSGKRTTSLSTALVDPATGTMIPLPLAMLPVEPVWSPDSAHVMLRNVANEIEVIDLNGQTQHRLALFKEIRQISWLDNQTLLVLVRLHGKDDDTTPLQFITWSLADNSVRDYSPPLPYADFVRLSPDSKLAFIPSYLSPRIINVQTGRTLVEKTTGAMRSTILVWSGDSRYFLIAEETGGSHTFTDTVTGQALNFSLYTGGSFEPTDIHNSGFAYFDKTGGREHLGLFRFTETGMVQEKIGQPGAYAGVLCLPEKNT